MKFLSVVISTVLERFTVAFSLGREIIELGLDVVLVVQKSDIYKLVNIEGVQVVYSREVGLSKSRNIGLKMTNSSYVWLIDDDIGVDKSNLEIVLNKLKIEKPDIYIGRIGCSDMDGYYKNYNKIKKIHRLSMLRISSIEIILRKNFVLNSNIKFNENIGLGTEYPSGEENVFLLDCFDSGARMLVGNEIIAYHPCSFPHGRLSRNWMNPGIPKSKGVIARRIGGVSGFALLVRWVFRAIMGGVPAGLALNILKGYFHGRQILK